MHLRRALNDPAGIVIHILIGLCSHSPHFHLQMSRFTDHISGTACHQFSHIDSGIPMAVSGNGMEIQHRCGRRQHSIIACFRRCCRVSRLSVKFHIHLRGCQTVSIADSDHALLLILFSAHMRPKHHIHVIKMSLLHNGLCPADTFLRRLENKFDGSTKLVFHAAEYLCRSKSYCNMAVMTAGMHIPWSL